jgi:GNAT superfamily N-acetyltransferase
MKHFLDNVIWHCLSGSHLNYSDGTDEARRYSKGFSPIVGFANLARPNFDALSRFCEPGEHFYCEGWPGAVPDGWKIDHESTVLRMIWEGPMASVDEAPEASPLSQAHASQALELANLTRPGPFGPRTIELGDYFGLFEGERLIAMAGERLCADSCREISGVCTHPEFQGRGFARRLMRKLIRREMQRNETPFLHVMHDNTNARRLYEQMGFRDYREMVVRIISLSIA